MYSPMPERPDPGPPQVSVVVPTRNKAPRLRLTLACLARQTGGDRIEVVVVDDASTDHTADVLREAAACLPLVVVDGRGQGRASARNLGARHAGADWLVFLDDDVLVGGDFVAAHLAAKDPDRFVHGRLRELAGADRMVEELRTAPAEEIARARDELLERHPDRPARRYRTHSNALERAIEAMVGGTLDDVAPWLGCVGANTAMSRRAFERVGGFDEGFGTTWGCEDLELGYRLHHAGVRRALAGAALGVHLTHRRPDRWEQHEVNLDRFRSLHPEPSVHHLDLLLGPRPDPLGYAAAVRTAEQALTRSP